ncbi:MAG: dUTP diphosphatase [Planctomycetota bacterium]
MPHVHVVRLPHFAGLPLPSYATAGSAGIDLVAAITDPIELAPGRRELIKTGLKIAIPAGFEAQIRPRSGLAANHGITVLNSPGTIDSDFRGELQVMLINLGQDPMIITRGTRIAQLILAKVERLEWQPVEDLAATKRGEGGFGSTGKH